VLAPEYALVHFIHRSDVQLLRLPIGHPVPPPRPGLVVFTMERGEKLVRLQ
jgi:hypothetical protein